MGAPIILLCAATTAARACGSRGSPVGEVMPGPPPGLCWPAGVDSPGLSCRPDGLRGGAAGLGEVAGLCVLTLAGDHISAITGFTDNSVQSGFALAVTLETRGLLPAMGPGAERAPRPAHSRKPSTPRADHAPPAPHTVPAVPVRFSHRS